jgi:predicted RNase H-like nuclease
MQLLGIDGCKAGWLIAGADHLDRIEFDVQETLEGVFEQARRGQVVAAIDIPIGLSLRSPRQCDVVARTSLPSTRKSCVFPSPSRAALTAETFEQACDLNAAASGKRISRQLFGILRKIREVDRLIDPGLQMSVRETHPEVVLAVLGGRDGAPRLPKDIPEGQKERIALLSMYFPQMDADTIRQSRGKIARVVGSNGVSIDDVIDATACLLVSHWINLGVARSLPADRVEVDDRGLRMEIVIPPENALVWPEASTHDS